MLSSSSSSCSIFYNYECIVFFVVGIAQFECGPHPPLLNGQILIENTSATYMCDYGYLLIGREYRICDITRNWQGSQPVCKGMAAYIYYTVGSLYYASVLFMRLCDFSLQTHY